MTQTSQQVIPMALSQTRDAARRTAQQIAYHVDPSGLRLQSIAIQKLLQRQSNDA